MISFMPEGEEQQRASLSVMNLSLVLSLKATLVKINGQPLLYVKL